MRSRRDGLCWGAECGAAVINHGEREKILQLYWEEGFVGVK